MGRETWPVSCTCDATIDHAVQFGFLLPWLFMILPTNLLPTTAFQPLVSSRCEFCRCAQTKFLKHLQVLRPSHLSVPSPFFLAIELTENQCRSVRMHVERAERERERERNKNNKTGEATAEIIESAEATEESGCREWCRRVHPLIQTPRVLEL